MSKSLFRTADKLAAALQKEKEGDLISAEKLYLQIIVKTPTSYKAYERLMVIYRKLKEYSKELAIIKKAIKAFEASYLERQKQWITENKAAARMSRSLAVSLGVIDKRGLPTTFDPMLVRWNRRRELVTKRIEKAAANKAK